VSLSFTLVAPTGPYPYAPTPFRSCCAPRVRTSVVRQMLSRQAEDPTATLLRSPNLICSPASSSCIVAVRGQPASPPRPAIRGLELQWLGTAARWVLLLLLSGLWLGRVKVWGLGPPLIWGCLALVLQLSTGKKRCICFCYGLLATKTHCAHCLPCFCGALNIPQHKKSDWI
jgi:hypothetical protein